MRHVILPLALLVGLTGCAPADPPAGPAAPATETPRVDVVPEKTARQEYEEGPKYDYSDLGAPPKTKPAEAEPQSTTEN